MFLEVALWRSPCLSGMGKRFRLWRLISLSAAGDDCSTPWALSYQGEDFVAAVQKTPGRTATAKIGSKNKASKRQPVTVTLPPPPLAPSQDRRVEVPGFLIVGIGASAGGLEAMEEFFNHMPPSSGMAFVVVSHQHAGHVSLLPSLLGKCTAMPVVEAKDGMPVEANHVFLAPGGINLAIL